MKKIYSTLKKKIDRREKQSPKQDSVITKDHKKYKGYDGLDRFQSDYDGDPVHWRDYDLDPFQRRDYDVNPFRKY